MPFGSTSKKRSRRLLLPAGAGAVLASSLLVLTNISTASGAVQTVTATGARQVVPAVSTTHRTSGRVTAPKPVATRTVSITHHAAAKATAHKATRRHTHRHEASHHAAAKTTTSSTTTVSDSSSTSATEGYGCADALSYLESHAAAGFSFECPGYALGHQAMTCIDVAGVCAGEHLIVINDPCQAAYMNEASNSWVLEGLREAPIDPYGYCHY